ncbi:MAG: caspase domain-containing protein, partial [Chthoniobacterales bacterium]
MKRIFCHCYCFVLLLSPLLASKEALLIANADYSHLGKLPNPVPDARQLADVLRRIGFNVGILENASREDMLLALGDFEERLRVNRGIAFFHYGGHGVQVDGKNYLIPADANIPDEKRVATRAIDVDEVMSALDASGAAANVVVLDACRDNPLPATSTRSAARGLSFVARKPKNSIIIYAAEADNRALDGLFTPVLSRAIAESGNRDISEVMKQVRKEVFSRSD